MYDVLTDDRELVRGDLGDRAHFFAEYVDGSGQEPLEGAINAVACWGDTAAVREDPGRAAVDAEGTRATPEAEGHHWGTVCPTDPDYRASLLERIERVGRAGDVRLTTLGLPGEDFCRCERCEERFAASAHDDRVDWRTETITAFVAAARVEGDLLATLYPDPYPGNLRKRAGLDPDALAAHVDGFLVPLCGPGYETVYWVESLARGFARELEGIEASLAIQLSAERIAPDRLAGVTRRIEPHADSIVYGTFPDDADTVRETIRLLREEEAAVAAD